MTNSKLYPMKNIRFYAALLLSGAFSVACTDTSSNQSVGNVSQQEHITLGHIEATAIQDNATPHFMPVTLFPDAGDNLISALDQNDGIPSSMSAFWVTNDSISILFDTGMGGPQSQLLPRLKSLGISPEEVEYIYLTHFHGDHIGGLMRGDTIVFPNAQLYASKVEYEAWLDMEAGNGPATKAMNAYNDRLHLFAFGDTLPGEVIALSGIGHTPGHTVYRIGDLLIVGDIIHGAALQIPHPEVCATYDMDKEEAIKTRRYYLDYAQKNQLTMAGMHFPAPGFK